MNMPRGQALYIHSHILSSKIKWYDPPNRGTQSDMRYLGHHSKLPGVMWHILHSWRKRTCQMPYKPLAWGISEFQHQIVLYVTLLQSLVFSGGCFKITMVWKLIWKHKSGSKFEEIFQCSTGTCDDIQIKFFLLNYIYFFKMLLTYLDENMY